MYEIEEEDATPEALEAELLQQQEELEFTAKTGMLPPSYIQKGIKELTFFMSLQAIKKLSFEAGDEAAFRGYLNWANDPHYAQSFIKAFEDKIEVNHPVMGTSITITRQS